MKPVVSLYINRHFCGSVHVQVCFMFAVCSEGSRVCVPVVAGCGDGPFKSVPTFLVNGDPVLWASLVTQNTNYSIVYKSKGSTDRDDAAFEFCISDVKTAVKVVEVCYRFASCNLCSNGDMNSGIVETIIVSRAEIALMTGTVNRHYA